MQARKTFICLAAFVCLAASAALADSQARIVRLSYSEGDVQIDRGDSNGPIHAFLNMPVIEGSKLTTGHDARVEVEFEDGSTMRLVPDSQVEFQELRLRSSGGRASLISVQQGTAYFNLRKRNEDEFRVAAGQEQVALGKSSRFRVEVSQAAFKLAVFKGDLDLIRANGERVPLRKDETFELDLNDPARYFLSRGVTQAAFDYWDQDREKQRDEYARSRSILAYNSGYAYGMEDLARYGSFFDVAGYGSLWRPAGFGIGWDPFVSGAWVWYPSFGYVWVSPYNWGWTPYRYGQWLFVNNHGWCWRPTRVWNTWYPAPPVVSPRVIYTKNVPPPHREPVVVVGNGFSGNGVGGGVNGGVNGGLSGGTGHGIAGGAGSGVGGGVAGGASNGVVSTRPARGVRGGVTTTTTVVTNDTLGKGGSGNGVITQRGGRDAREARDGGPETTLTPTVPVEREGVPAGRHAESPTGPPVQTAPVMPAQPVTPPSRGISNVGPSTPPPMAPPPMPPSSARPDRPSRTPDASPRGAASNFQSSPSNMGHSMGSVHMSSPSFSSGMGSGMSSGHMSSGGSSHSSSTHSNR